MAGFLAYIIPVDQGAYPDNTLPRPQPPQPGVPTHPIYNPPYPSQGPGFPTHPIVLPPGTIWPPARPPYPDHTLPGNLPYPDQGLPQPPLGYWGPNDPRPTPPIYIPITPPPTEGNPHPEHPIYIPVYPANPIVIPPGTSPEEIKAKLEEIIGDLTGNLPTNPNPAPTPV